MVQIRNGGLVVAEFFSYASADQYFTYELDHHRYPDAVIVCADEDQWAERDHE